MMKADVIEIFCRRKFCESLFAAIPRDQAAKLCTHSCSVHVTIIIRYLLRRIHAAQLPGLHAR